VIWANKKQDSLNCKQDFIRARSACESYLKIWNYMGNGMKCLRQTQVLPGSPCNQHSRHMQLIPQDFWKKQCHMMYLEKMRIIRDRTVCKEFGLRGETHC